MDESPTREVGRSDGTRDNNTDEIIDDDDVFVWSDGEDSELASRRLYRDDGRILATRDDDRVGDKYDERVEELERRLVSQWKYWGEDEQAMVGKARKGVSGKGGKSKSGKRCIYNRNERSPRARGGMNRLRGKARAHV